MSWIQSSNDGASAGEWSGVGARTGTRKLLMNTHYATSPDGTKLAYDRNGSGPAIVLIHGGGGNRQIWHEIGYVNRLSKDFTVITFDLRGHGESGLPINPEDYTSRKMGQDILTVADACGFEHFIIWGMSFGGKISRYLAAQSERIEKLILMGVPMGPGVTNQMREDIRNFCNHWLPILQAQRDGSLVLDSLSENDREFLLQFNVPVMMAWGQAMLAWKPIEPNDFLCPTLWLIGSKDQPAMESFRKYKNSLKDTKVQHHIFEDLDHTQVLVEIDSVLPTMLAFTRS